MGVSHLFAQKGRKVKCFRLCRATLRFHVSRKAAGTTACPRSYCRSHTAGWGFVIIFQGGRLIIATEILSTTGFPGRSVVKNSSANTGDTGWSPGSGRSPGEGNGTPLQYSCLGSPIDREPGGLQSRGSQESQTQLSD